MNWATLCPAETIAPGQSRGFDPLTGLCTLGPCLGQSLRSVPLRQGTQGWLQVDTAGLHAIRNEEPTGSDTFNQGDTT